MRSKVAVIGCGRVGSTIVDELSKRYDVVVVDADAGSAGRSPAPWVGVGPTDNNMVDVKLAVNAVPGRYGFEVLRKLIELDVPNIIDISYFEEDSFELEAFALERGVNVVVDCGLAPGLWNMVVGHYHSLWGHLDDVTCYVGGLPAQRVLPWQYKAGYSTGDVLAMYTRPSRDIVDGDVVVRPAMTEVVRLDTEVGTLEAFNTDGLRSLLRGNWARNMKEMTLRYPGHVDLMRMLTSSGFLAVESVSLRDAEGRGGRVDVRPFDVTAALLDRQWRFNDTESDVTIMRIDVAAQGRQARFSLLDIAERDDHTKNVVATSMARTTGYTCTAVVDAVMDAVVQLVPGIVSPEELGSDAVLYDHVLGTLRAKGITIVSSEASS